MKSILVVGRHPLDNIQVAELEEVFGDEISIVMDSRFVKSVDSIVSTYNNGGYDAMVTMLPLNMVAQLTSRGICPIRSNRPNTLHSGFDVVTDVIVNSVPLKQAVADEII